MIKNKNNKVIHFITLLAPTTLIIQPFFSISVALNSPEKNEDLIFLKDLMKNNEKFQKYLEVLNLNEILEKAKNNEKIIDWIQNLTYKTYENLEKDIISLSKIDVSREIKSIMLKKLLTKFENFQIKSNKPGRKRWVQNYKQSNPYKNPGTHYVYMDPQNLKNKAFYRDRPILNKGEDVQKTWDHVFNDDDTHIFWSTDFIYKYRIHNIMLKLASNINKFKDKFSGFLIEGLSQEKMMEINEENLSEYLKPNFRGKSNEKIIIDELLKSVRLLTIEIDSFIKLSKTLPILKDLATLGGKAKKIFLSLASVSVYSTIASFLGGVYYLLDGIIEFTNSKFPSREKLFIKSALGALGIASGAISIAVLAGALSSNFITMGIGGIFALASISLALMEYWKLRNGYSIWENFHDHGLNDWEYQLKNNGYVLSEIAQSFSDDFNNPIEWKVSDGWFTLPKLKIRTGQHRGNFVSLGENDSFNWGSKIPLRLKNK